MLRSLPSVCSPGRRICACLVLNLIVLAGCQDERKPTTLFRTLHPQQTGIQFENRLNETEDFNIVEYLYFYNGGGVAAGDINNDGFTDLYFTSNQGLNKLYLNKGNFRFEDITERAGVAGNGNWKTGVAMADVNGDGLLDIYVCGVGGYKHFSTRNQLFINKGDLTFEEEASSYGLAFQGLSTQASFFDYDQDGDLDMYLLNHSVHSVRSYGNATERNESDSLAGDRLYRNEADRGLKLFTDVTKASGIYNSRIGYGLGIATCDINMDGRTDIYVSNDFRENDYLYLNTGNGRFKQSIESSMGHSSRFSMGNDIADLNNDLLPDILTVDMMPEEEKSIKASVGEDSYEIYKYKLNAGYYYQVSRNALQLNRGQAHFSDIAWLSGVAATDWSWAPLIADFDNDGHKDIFITNGIVRRPNDLNYLNFISTDSAQRLTDVQLAGKMPEGKVSNRIFRNKGDLAFEDRSKDWGMGPAGCSNGAAYADLDNDGDLDIIINNINQKASILENTLSDSSRHSLRIQLRSGNLNTHAIGAKVITFIDSARSYIEVSPARGYQSSVDYTLNIGLGTANHPDSLWVIWPGGGWQSITQFDGSHTLTLSQRDALPRYDYSALTPRRKLFDSISLHEHPRYRHRENDYVDFNIQGLMPHMLSEEGPRMAVGDVNGDGLNDFYVGGGRQQPGMLYIQSGGGGFNSSNESLFAKYATGEETDALLFDADKDGDNDLAIVYGGNEGIASDSLNPQLFLNDGRGHFKASNGMPSIHCNASCVRSADFDGDGDNDLFIGARSVPLQYGISPPSFILINKGGGVFEDRTSNILSNSAMGMITDAAWNDFNGDHRMDLLVVGEWMAPTLLLQTVKGTLNDQTSSLGLDSLHGWWSALEVADLDGDGDPDFAAGNLGLNSRLKASPKEPVRMYVGDFDGNGSTEQILTYYNQGISYPFVSRDQLVKQIPPLRRKFLRYGNYVNARIGDVLSQQQIDLSEQKWASHFASVWFENQGDKFIRRTLPVELQFAPVFSIRASDVNGDGHVDLLSAGNRFATQPDFGRYDAGYGLVLLGKGGGQFTALSPAESGWWVAGEARDIRILDNQKKRKLYLVSRNDDTIVSFITASK